MERLFGWMVPILHSGRGCAAARRFIREQRCLIRDVTWEKQPVWICLPDGLNIEIVQQIQRLIPAFDLKDNEETFGAGEGMIHCLDAFPRDAVAPVSWIGSRKCLQEQSDRAPSFYIYFFTHPTCQRSLLESLAKAMHTVNCSGPYQGVVGGLQYYELRGGDAAVSTLRQCLPNAAISSDLPHGQMVQLQSNPLVLVRSVSPRSVSATSCTHQGVCGLDVIIVGYPASDELFLSLVREGGACAIGVTEAAALCTSCEPPMPVFPRDYPDTAQGQMYWKGGNAEIQQDWAYVRWHIESGEGRIRDFDHRRLLAVDYGSLVKDKSQSDAKVIVVRDQFLQPFERAMQGLTACISIQADKVSRRPRRRKRRSGAKERTITTARKGTNSRAEAHQKICNTLLKQLALPALLLAHIQVETKGVFKAGAPLYRVKTAERPMGFATFGEFCTVRGRYHGMGLVSASCLLEALASACDEWAIVVDRSSGSCQTVCLRARIQGKLGLHDVILGL